MDQKAARNPGHDAAPLGLRNEAAGDAAGQASRLSRTLPSFIPICSSPAYFTSMLQCRSFLSAKAFPSPEPVPGPPQTEPAPSRQWESDLTSAMQNKSDAATMDGCCSSCSQRIWKGSFRCPALSCTSVTQPTCPCAPSDSHACRRTAQYHREESKRANAPAAPAPHGVSAAVAHWYADPRVSPTSMQLGDSNTDAVHQGREGSFFILVLLPAEQIGSSVFPHIMKVAFFLQNLSPQRS